MKFKVYKNKQPSRPAMIHGILAAAAWWGEIVLFVIGVSWSFFIFCHAKKSGNHSFSPKTPCFPWFPILFSHFLPGSATRAERHRAAAAPVRGVLRGAAAAADAAQGGADRGQGGTARCRKVGAVQSMVRPNLPKKKPSIWGIIMDYPLWSGKIWANTKAIWKIAMFWWLNFKWPFSIALFTRRYGISMGYLAVQNLQNGVESGRRYVMGNMMVDDHEWWCGWKNHDAGI